MGIFSTNRLRSKIILSVIVSISISLIFAALLIFNAAKKYIKEREISDIRILVRIIGMNCSASLVFNDKTSASEILSSFEAANIVESAVLYDKNGKEFALYIKKGSIYIPNFKEDLERDDYFVVVENIVVKGEEEGKLVVRANYSNLYKQIRKSFSLVGLGLIIAIISSLLLILLFTRYIFKPFSEILSTIKNISDGKDFSLRVNVNTEDEFGIIARDFNEMLSQIESRDKEINRYKNHLEEEVERRTRELNEAKKRLEEELEEHRRMEEIIVRSANEWRTTFDAIKDVVFLLDENGVILRCNKSATELLGIGFDKIIGNNICIIAHGDMSHDCGIGETKKNLERTVRNINLGDKVFQVVYDPILSSGKLIGFVHIMSDITEKQTLEENMRQLQKMEAVGRLAGGVAHDFNNILSVMNIYTGSLLKRLKDDQRSLNELTEIKKAVERATNLSRQLLTFSRKQITNPVAFDVNESIKNNHKMLSRLIEENIKIELNLCDTPANIFADQSQFENAIMNMVINSRDAMPNGGIIRFISEVKELTKDDITLSEFWGKRFLILKISDNGEGMSEEVKRKIFEPFFTTKPKGKGTGLGLAMVYGFVRQCNGYIDVESKLKEGTTFTIYLPITEKEGTSKPASGLIKIVSNKEVRILLVEDDNDVRKSILKMLTDNGFIVFEMDSPIKALEYFIKNRGSIDFILTDIIMPGMDGIALSKKIREIDIRIPILFMTGYSDDFLPQEDMERYKDTILQKPFSESQLINKIKEMLV